VAGLTITELSKATGVSASALRFYERRGLLSPAGRSPGGYRVYDALAVERLTFIGRAKRLGLSLDEIGDLVGLWEDGPCAPVQTQLQALVDDKVDSLDSRIDELAGFRAQLAHVQRSLASATPADQCGPGCGCDADLPTKTVAMASFGRQEPAQETTAPISCTLAAGDADTRIREWQSLLERVESRESSPDGLALRLPLDAELLASLAALAAREVECCSFFTFTMTVDSKAAWLQISAPANALPLVNEVFGSAGAPRPESPVAGVQQGI
jgi:DNA-binding transcriptional MerR regulator